jgi:Domain of unknown function (DUF4815)
MAQKTDLNISPYYDDFDSEKNFYKVLFKPGYPIQARELTTLQSLLQDQVKSFGSHIFKEGSMVIPGNIAYDGNFNSVKLNSSNFGVDVSLYIKNFIGKKVTGQISGTTATIQFIAFPDDINVDDLTIYVKYIDSDNNFEFNPFENGESLIADENITYGNTTINAGTPFASLLSSNATSIGSAASIGDGVYFIRGYFVNVSKQTIILDNYTNVASYRVGLKIDELIIGAKDDSSLYDPSKGFTNYAAPGADRFKINLTLTKKLLSDFNDTDFIELLRVENGKIKIIESKTQYNIIKDYMAQRTYDESGDYTVSPFNVSVNNSLNDRLGNNGLFFDTETTEQNNKPSEDLMCLKISPGKAYVRGYDIDKISTTIIDVNKSRDTESIKNVNIPFEMGNILRVNNVSGTPKSGLDINLIDRFKSEAGITTIGIAKVYNFNLTDSAYTGNTTNWDLYLFDIQTHTHITINQLISDADLPATSHVKGKSSGSSGFAVVAGGNSSIIRLKQTSGTFSVGEQLLINGLDFPRSIKSVITYSTEDIKSVQQPTSISGLSAAFTSDCLLEKFRFPNSVVGIAISTVSGTTTVSSPGKVFTGVKVGSIIRYQSTNIDETFNRVTAVSSTGTSLTIADITGISGIFSGTHVDGNYNAFIGAPIIRNESQGFLYSRLPDSNISSVNLSDSLLSISHQITGVSVSGNVLTLTPANIVGISSAFFAAFDEERYSVHYTTDGTIAKITSDQFVLNSGTVTISGLPNGSVVVNTTLIKNGIQSKVKTYNRSQTLTVGKSKYTQSGTGSNNSIDDGLTYNQYYGLRIQDEEISLNYPDVVKIISVYESFDSSAPVLDKIQFSASATVSTNAIIGEDIIGNTSKAVARVVSNVADNVLGIVYLNSERFLESESVVFSVSNIKTEIQTITPGKYKDITNSFTLNKGQKNQYYDYSKIVRNAGTPEPSKSLLVIFDYYSVPSNDSGDVFTVLSYDKERFTHDVPSIGPRSVRASDTLDFRPRVSTFSTNDKSPFDSSARTFSTYLTLSPNESSLIGYDYYLARIDKLYLDKIGNFILEKGISSKNPKASNKNDAVMEIATIKLPPYLYNPQNAIVTLMDNRRYTMRDIGLIEDRVETLERLTSLSLLEVSTQTLQIQDFEGNNRFKSGFFVDDFKNYQFINNQLSNIRVNPEAQELTPILSRNSLKSQISPTISIIDEELDFSENFELLDSNVQKTGKAVTLKYESVGWIEQAFATKVENVNPFNVIVYSGDIKLSPEIDNWVRTVQLPNKNVDITLNSSRTLTNNLTSNVFVELTPVQTQSSSTVFLSDIAEGQGNFEEVTGTDSSITSSVSTNTTSAITSNTVSDTVGNTDTSIRNVLISSSSESFMRSRNTGFSASNLKPSTQFYQFLDGNSGADFIPKLIEISNSKTLENYGASGAFSIGETVIGTYGGNNLISFRVASPNHKYGKYNSPSTTYTINPYVKSETIPSAYSQSSKVLNIDTISLSEEAQGKYSGYLISGMQLVGQTSGSVAYVKDLRLISDNFGDLIGAFFIRDPNSIPIPTVRISTGTKTFKLTSSSTNNSGLPGSTDTSSAETNYNSDGTLEQWENTVTATTKNLTTNTLTNLTTNTTTSTTTINTHTTTTVQRFVDPLAQSFVVGGNVEAPSPTSSNDDVNGAFLTAVDLFFAKKDDANAPVKVEIRTVELGTPTRIVIGNSVTLRPSEVSISDDASIATKVTFDEPIYLPPGREYAVVIISENSDKYEMWTAVMGGKTVNTKQLPDADSVTYSKQFSMGSLFKSQNGSIWTASQEQDLKFKLYKANFTSPTGTAFFYNPTLNESNGYIQKLGNNPITTFPKTVTLGITTISSSNTSLITVLGKGRKIAGTNNSYGYVIGTGSSVSTVVLTTGGSNYVTDANVSTYNITGNGSGLVLNITATAETITGTPVIVNPGNGYTVGDIVGIVTATVGTGSSVRGRDARITISAISGLDTLYLGNVQGETFASVGVALTYYDNNGTLVSLASTTIRTAPVNGSNQNSGNYIRINHFDNGMYANNNIVRISNVESSTAPVPLFSALTSSSASISVAAGDISNFGIFEGISVSENNPGYVKIGNEIIKYNGVGSQTLTGITRGIDSTIQIDHDQSSLVYKYELNGVSLRRINKTHNISDFDIGMDGYYVEIDRSANGTNVNRISDGSTAGMPQLQFASEGTFGGSKVTATENILYSSIVPTYDLITPGSKTSVSANIRSVTGTSVDGSETSFLDNGFEPIQLNSLNTLKSIRVVCSKENETEYLSGLARNKSFTTGITLSTTDKNLSPIIYLDTAFTEFISSRLNSPISDYSSDNRSNLILNDPHAAVYVSKAVKLVQPATSLKVILSAYRHESADFRVLYSLSRPDSSEIDQSFELFPGYDNLKYTTAAGYSVLDSSKNSGRPDTFVSSSVDNQFKEYEFTADNLSLFNGYVIKIVMSGTNQAYPPRIKELRTIAIR